MKILEFGDTSKRKIILIHGFQCPWQVWNKYIEYCAYRLKSAKPASWNLRFQRSPCVKGAGTANAVTGGLTLA